MFSIQRLFIIAVILVAMHNDSAALQIRNAKQQNKAGPKEYCKEVLTKNLECPSVGSYPVAGVCEYFARCIQTNNGVESEVDFCPDGQVYIVNRCIKSRNLDDCPQKSCPVIQPDVIYTTTMSSTMIKTTFATSIRPFTTRKPLSNLHPSRNRAVLNQNESAHIYSLLLIIAFSYLL